MDETDLAFAPIHRQAALIAAGEVSARALLEVYLERIAGLDSRLNAMRVVFVQRARVEADQADARRRAGDLRPLLGVPFAVKDDMDVAGEVTTLGTRAHGRPASRDGELVRRLRAAGAVIVAKTKVPELCLWPFTESASWGITRNPWDLQRTPGGSSGGSAAAVAGGLVGAALASDGGGSIRIPAAWCGLFGLKTQRGRVPMSGEPWYGLTVVGALTRCVRDSALFHDAIGYAGGDGAPSAPTVPWTAAVGDDPPSLRIAVSTATAPGVLPCNDPVPRATVREVAALLASHGHQTADFDPRFAPVDISAFLLRFLAGARAEAARLEHPELLERRTRTLVRAGARVGSRALAWAHAREHDVVARLDEVFAEHDVLMQPVCAAQAPMAGRYEGRGAAWTLSGVARIVPYCAHWNLTGQPACSVPCGFDDQGLPRAVQLVGRHGAEATLLALAAQIERAGDWPARRPELAL